ncbi:UpxY family transcription antiterminator [Flavobacteriaceae bacterium]|nr:UpxY family transcription antiterminator [Flavobacteriaceae bacterium]
MNFNKGWHVLYVKSRAEKKVDKALKELFLESFLPQVKTIRQWSDRKKTIVTPLIPSYVFVNIKSRSEFHKAQSVNGSCTFLKIGKEYVKEKEIKNLKLLIEDVNINDIKTNKNTIKIGDIKKITSGPLIGLKCRVIKTGNKNKIIVKIDSLQQEIIATIPPNYLEDKNKKIE